MKARRGTMEEEKADEGPLDPYAELFRMTERYKSQPEKKDKEEGNVTNSLAMLTAIPEVDLGMEYVFVPSLMVVHGTEYAVARGSRTSKRLRKRSAWSLRNERGRESLMTMRLISWHRDVRFAYSTSLLPNTDDFEVYQPNLRAKSDADIIRDAKLEAMGLLPEDHEPRRESGRSQMATDEMVSAAIYIDLYPQCSCPFRSWNASRSECVNDTVHRMSAFAMHLDLWNCILLLYYVYLAGNLHGAFIYCTHSWTSL